LQLGAVGTHNKALGRDPRAYTLSSAAEVAEVSRFYSLFPRETLSRLCASADCARAVALWLRGVKWYFFKVKLASTYTIRNLPTLGFEMRVKMRPKPQNWPVHTEVPQASYVGVQQTEDVLALQNPLNL
jgi:hypothetical protein